MDLKSENKNIKVKVFGIGGAGTNAVNYLIDNNSVENTDIDLWVINTDIQDLESSKNKCKNKILLTSEQSRGYGSGSDPRIGKECAFNSQKEIKEALEGTDVLVITAGLGGGTGTGATSAIAQIARDMNILTIAVLFTPFSFEGKLKLNIANKGLEEIKEVANSYIVISNQEIFNSYSQLPIDAAFKMANKQLINLIRTIDEILNKEWDINVDFNDFKNLISNGKNTVATHVQTSGNERVKQAVLQIIKENNLDKLNPQFKNVIVSFKLDSKGTLGEVSQAIDMLQEYLNDDVFIKTGMIKSVKNDTRESFFIMNFLAGQGEFSAYDLLNNNSNNIEKSMNEKDTLHEEEIIEDHETTSFTAEHDDETEERFPLFFEE
ncbi:cell division protein FtsZ [Mycoplasma tauri]|uniref:Cell division protein FtsZ n=1 Tax=Mycoplasma tauri TaxID=547987 RepID=A0A953NEQ7_9MOLU|nr:cell division protein FtsZ [Mycoplasma tauri]MBZ4195637.1 cell division FtsZ family protein [Mycoplasma tauri]MBZ4203643.1 cell division FtsZ family protein [Mycoplasma tauri]MBZ4212527.1 cell division FtsZ family protein [Mycoplasma tauri]MBZ4218536.1 cell division FtsZ family protein [Mycoplasma tauri]MBZ4227060.1 cell division FtsZ family protein [Mycoplasma tauri]